MWHFNFGELLAMQAPMDGVMAKLNWDTDGIVEFDHHKLSVRHRFTQKTYTLTPQEKKGDCQH